MWRQAGERIRVLRRHLRLTQARLAAMAHVSVTALGRIERGEVSSIPVGTVDRVAAALGASLRLTIAWHGEALDRLTDSAHAELQNAFAELLRAAGWLVAVEVSFNHYGDRGRCDALALHPATGILIVVEVKTAIGDVQELLGRLHTKVRLAAVLAASQGWPSPWPWSRFSCWRMSGSSTASSPTTPRSSPGSACAAAPLVHGCIGQGSLAACSYGFP